MNSVKIFIDYQSDNNYQVVGLDKQENISHFSFKNQQNESIKSNIYLAKVSRIEHSLQAAFVDYGNGKSGFLPFSEIHPNYYQIPETDKKKIQELLTLSYKKYL